MQKHENGIFAIFDFPSPQVAPWRGKIENRENYVFMFLHVFFMFLHVLFHGVMFFSCFFHVLFANPCFFHVFFMFCSRTPVFFMFCSRTPSKERHTEGGECKSEHTPPISNMKQEQQLIFRIQ